MGARIISRLDENVASRNAFSLLMNVGQDIIHMANTLKLLMGSNTEYILGEHVKLVQHSDKLWKSQW